MHNPPGFFAIAILTAYTIVIGLLSITAVLGVFSILVESPQVLISFVGLGAITSIIVLGLHIWLRRRDARVGSDHNN